MGESRVSGQVLVPVSYHRFYLLDIPQHGLPALGPSNPTYFHNGLISTQPGISVITTGIADGDVLVSVELYDKNPPVSAADWDEVVEVSLSTVNGRVVVAALDADLPAPLPQLTPHGPGDYRVRIHARGRDLATDLAVLEQVESYLIEAWPAEFGDEIIYRATDSYGAAIRRLAMLEG